MPINTNNIVRELAVSVPGATRIFEQVGIDYCCGGGQTLAEACKKSSASVATVIQLLEATEHSINPGEKERDWQVESLTSLAAYIIDTHHFFTKWELIRLGNLLDKVCSRHGENNPELSELRTVFERLKQELIPHMLREEQVLFPFIAQMEEAVSEQRAILRHGAKPGPDDDHRARCGRRIARPNAENQRKLCYTARRLHQLSNALSSFAGVRTRSASAYPFGKQHPFPACCRNGERRRTCPGKHERTSLLEP